MCFASKGCCWDRYLDGVGASVSGVMAQALCPVPPPRWDAGDWDGLFIMLVTSISLLLQNSSKMIPLPHLQLSHPAINQLEKHCVYRYINIINIYIYFFEILYFSDYIFSTAFKNCIFPLQCLLFCHRRWYRSIMVHFCFALNFALNTLHSVIAYKYHHGRHTPINTIPASRYDWLTAPLLTH